MNVRIEDANTNSSIAAATRRRAEWITAAVWFAFAMGVFRARLDARANGPTTVAALVLFAGLIGAALSLSVEACRRALRLLAIGPVAKLFAGPAAVTAAILAYTAVSGLPLLPRIAAYGAYLFAPAVIAGVRRTGEPSPLRVLAAALVLWLPIEFRLLPSVPLPITGGLRAAEFAALANGLYLFLVARPVERVGYTFLLARRDAALAVVGTLGFALPGIAIGLATHFLAWHPRVTVLSAGIVPFAIYLATAVPEEFLFRGLIQNSLQRLLGRAGLPIAAVIFGLAHLPDPRYVCLATLAGFAYGWVFVRTRRITASAITHALVDWIWVLFFRAG